MNPDGMVALLDFREDGVTPYMIFFKDGLEIEKCVSTEVGECAQRRGELLHLSLVLLYPC